jgi:hypothetical protein
MPTSLPALFSRLLAVLVLAGIASACGTRVVREEVYANENVRVQLRHSVYRGGTIPQGYAHPGAIADVRIAHILASLTYLTDKGAPEAVIRIQHVYPLAEGITRALEKATPDDLVVAWAVTHDRRLGIFSDVRVTAFQLYLDGSQLYLTFYAVQEGIERSALDDWQPKKQLPDRRPSFKLRAEKAQALDGARTLVVDWRDDYYRQPLALRARGGRLKRRTILMQDEELAAEQGEQDPSSRPLPPDLSDNQLRALDQLDGARRAGIVSEAEFQRRRRLILRGQLAEAGYVDPGGNEEPETE